MPRNVGVVLTLKDRFSSKMKDMAEKLGTTEKKLQKATMTVRKFSNEVGKGFQNAVTATTAGIGALVGGSYALANKTAEVGDRIDKMSQKIGLSRQKYQEWDYILSQSGSDIDKMQVGMKTLSQQMVASTKKGSDAEAMFKKLGVSVKDSNGKFISQEEAFEKVIMAFQKMPDGIEKANLAQKLFGKTGSDLRPLLNGVRGNVEELKKKFQDLGMAISDETVDASVKFTDTQDTLKRSFGAMGVMIGGELIPIMQQASDYIIENMPTIRAVAQDAIGKVSNILKFLADNMNVIIPIATACVSSIVAFNTISTVVKTVQTLRSVIQAVSVAQGIWNALMLANPIGLIAMGVGALIGVIALLVMNWDKVSATVQNWWQTTVKAVSSMWTKCKEVFGAIGGFIKEHFVDILMLALGPVGLIIKGVQGIAGAVSKLKEGKAGKEGEEKPSRHALGTPYFQGGSTSINEGGRGEIVNLPSGSQIIPHDIAKRSNQKSISLEVKFDIAGNLIGTRELFEEFAEMLLEKVENKLQTV